MNLLYVIDSLKYGGTERQLLELVNGIFKKYDQQIKITIICLVKSENSYVNQIQNKRIKVVYCPRKFKFDFLPVLKIYKIIKKESFDIVHSFNNLGAVFGAIAAKLANKPLVCSAIRDAKDWNTFSKYTKYFLAYISDIYISNSVAGFKNRFRHSRNNFVVVYNGIDLKRFENREMSKINIKRNLGLESFSHIIGMIAALSKRKDHETLVYSAKKVIKKYPHACFLLVGDGEKREQINTLIKKEKLEKNFVLLGYRNDCDLINTILDISIVLTNTGFHYEGISNSIMESIACRVPVIATNGGGTEEIIKHLRSGIIVPYKDSKKVYNSIISLIENFNKRKLLSDNAFQHLKKICDIEHYVDKHIFLYNSILNDNWKNEHNYFITKF